MATTTLAGGCFWCIESAFNAVKGINSAVSGYMGGHSENPDYRSVCTGQTGHAEVVQLNFDENEISFRDILEIFFALHDPTQLNRQGNDVGTQYRSAVFYHDEKQQQAVNQIIKEMTLEKTWDSEIVTEVSPAATFYPAEDYHQGYAENNPQNQYCAMVVSPKLKKFKAKFASKLK